MKIYRILLLCFLTALLIPMESEAQRDVYDWQISPYAGLLTVDNDISFPKNANTFAYGLRLERRLGNDFTMGLHFAQLDLGDAVQDNISGGFLSLAYHWDNGYLLSQRSFLSVFHRIEIGYADRYSTFESINSKSADFAFGFENGLKFRLGDRISADVALEVFSSKANLTHGDITENIRYNVWKVGITYHFGSRKSKYVAPVFVPRTSIPSYLDKMETKGESIWIVSDSVYNAQVKLPRIDNVKGGAALIPQLNRGDSLLIFMHFDSLYQRRTATGTWIPFVDSMAVDSMVVDSMAIQKYDSLKTNDSLVSPIDSSKYSLRTPESIFLPVDTSQYHRETSDSLVSPIDSSKYHLRSPDPIFSPTKSSQYVDSGGVIIRADSLKSDTLPVIKRAPVDSSSMSRPAVSDTVVILKGDTVKEIKASSVDAPIISRSAVSDTVVILKTDTVKEIKRSSVDAPIISTPVVSDTVVILKTDTVYKEIPQSKSLDQNPDTSAQMNIIENGQGRVDTLYIVKDADQPRKKSNEGTQETVKKTETTRTTQTTSAQDAKISNLEAEIDRLKKENKKKNTRNVVAAGAAGTVLGAVVSKDKKSEKDTVYVANTENTTRIDSLQKELDILRKEYGISDTTSVAGAYTPNPPIGMYFAQDDDSTSMFLLDSTYPLETDSGGIKPDTLSTLKNDVLNDTDAHTSAIRDTTTVPTEVNAANKSQNETKVNSEKPEVKEPKMADKASNLKGEYPVSCNFGLNMTSLDADELKKLDLVIDDLKNADNRKVVLTGYTDKSGNADYNLQLSNTRANAVRDHLVSKGIDASRIEINAGGVLTSAEKYSPNARRVEVQVE